MDPKRLLDNLSTHLKNALANAIGIATALRHARVELPHVFLALLEEHGAIASEIIKKSGVSKEDLAAILSRIPEVELGGQTTATAVMPELDRSIKKALEKAMLLAYEQEHRYIGTEHLLYGILHMEENIVDPFLSALSVDKANMHAQIQTVLESTSRFPEMEDVEDVMDDIHEMMSELQSPNNPSTDAHQHTHEQPNADPKPAQQTNAPAKEAPAASKKRRPTALDVFTIELTNNERQKTLDPVIGRADEIERLVHILCRRTKNNPVLVGEPGVGKTAIVEGLAKRISAGTVPDILKRKKIFSLDLPLLLAGTIYRGEFEARLKQLIDDCTADPEAILFIDELHNIIGAGSNSGTMDAANILKPALARGALHCIGATTFDEYKKYIVNDPALERRFQSIMVPEPSQKEAVAMLEGVKQYYEAFHNTRIREDAISAAVELSSKYIHDHFLPDKALDLIDEASSAVRVSRKQSKEEEKLFALEKSLATEEQKKEVAIREERFDDAMAHKEKTAKLAKRMEKMQKAIGKKGKQGRAEVTAAHVVNVLARKLRINPSLLSQNEWERLGTLESRLGAHVKGQDSVIRDLVHTLTHASLGLRRDNTPLASFLFAGPSGVGKTKLAKALAKELFFTDEALVTLDMSEFAESHGVSKLLGSPAGYVGYKERNRFFESLTARPHTVVLFDEFDKAHPDVRKLLYQILDEGAMTDSAGKKISFRHAVVILTTNIGAEIYKNTGIGFGNAGAKTGVQQNDAQRNTLVRAKIKEDLGASLLGRLGALCLFEPLLPETIQQIVRSYIDTMSAQLTSSRALGISADDAAVATLAQSGYDADTGARNLERTVDAVLHELLVSLVMNKDAKQKKQWTLTKSDTAYTLI